MPKKKNITYSIYSQKDEPEVILQKCRNWICQENRPKTEAGLRNCLNQLVTVKKDTDQDFVLDYLERNYLLKFYDYDKVEYKIKL